MSEQFEGYEISLSRSPDGKPIMTTDPDVPMGNGCMVGTPGDADLIYIHLDVTHNGKKFPVWVCQSREGLQELGLEAAIIAEHGPEIIEAVRKMEAP